MIINKDFKRDLIELMSEFNFITYDFFRSLSIRSVYLPIITDSISSPMGLGSDSLPVKVTLDNGNRIYLADSMQFYLEYAIRLHRQGVHYIMTTFRGEKLDETHLNVFYHSEAEIEGTLDDVISLVNNYVLNLCKGLYSNPKTKSIIKKYNEEKKLEDVEKLIKSEGNIPRIEFSEALKYLKEDETIVVENEFRAINRKGEERLIKKFDGPVWLTHPQAATVPFYQKLNKDNKHANAADLLLGFGEVVGAGERHFGSKEIMHSLRAHEVDSSEYEWYLEMKEKEPLQTAGFGMGIERFLMWLLNIDDIKEFTFILVDLNAEQESICTL